MDIRDSIQSGQSRKRQAIGEKFDSDKLEKAKASPVGTINKHQEMKMGDGTWKYVGKQGHQHPAAVEARNQGHYKSREHREREVTGMLSNELVTDIQKRVGKTFNTGVTGETMKVLKVESMNTTVSINGTEKKIPNKDMMSRLRGLKESREN